MKLRGLFAPIQSIVRASTSATSTAVSLQLIASLRKDTGASIQKCKEALEHSNRDIQLAIQFLRKRGEEINKQRSDKAESHRLSCIASDDFLKASITKVACLTDFASESELFVKFCESFNKAILSTPCAEQDINRMEVPMLGISQIHSHTLGDILSDLSTILTEPVTIQNTQIITGDLVGTYVHGKSSYCESVGASASVVALRLRSDLTPEKRAGLLILANKLARQVLATKPKYIQESCIPEDVISKEKEVLGSKIKQSSVLEKAFKGHMFKYISENCLMQMEWVLPHESTLTVLEYMQEECGKLGVNVEDIEVQKFVVM